MPSIVDIDKKPFRWYCTLMKLPMNPEFREAERDPYGFINEYVNELFRNQDSYSVDHLMGVSDEELHLLDPLYPLGSGYMRPQHLGEQSFEREATSFVDRLVFNALGRSRQRRQRVLTNVPFTATRSSRHLTDNSIDLMLTVGQLQLEGELIIDGETAAFSLENKLITIQVLDSDSHNDGRQPQDSVTYRYLPHRKELFAEPKKGQRHPDEELRVPLISNEKSDVENLRTLFEKYSTDAFHSY